MEIQAAIRRKRFSAFDVSGGQRLGRARIERSLRRKARSSGEQRRRSQSQKIAELASSYLRFLIALVRKLSLIRRRSGTNIVLVCHIF
jgi:hypothetical protein